MIRAGKGEWIQGEWIQEEWEMDERSMLHATFPILHFPFVMKQRPPEQVAGSPMALACVLTCFRILTYSYHKMRKYLGQGGKIKCPTIAQDSLKIAYRILRCKVGWT
jgi:hypothetical protein